MPGVVLADKPVCKKLSTRTSESYNPFSPVILRKIDMKSKLNGQKLGRI